jgi:hypothetical protein
MAFSNDLAAHFETLSHDERRSALSLLAPSFRPSDWWYLHELAKVHGYYQDVLGTVPLELAVAIASFLDPYEAVRLRRVSKRWNEVLTSETVCADLTRRWFPFDAERRGREGTVSFEKPWRWVFENSASRTLFMLQAKPSEARRIRSEKLHRMEEDHYEDHLISFYGERLAFVDRGNNQRSFSLINFITKDVLADNVATPSRQRLSGIYLIKDYVIAEIADELRLYVYNIWTQKSKLLHIPGRMFGFPIRSGSLFGFSSGRETLVLDTTIKLEVYSVGGGDTSIAAISSPYVFFSPSILQGIRVDTIVTREEAGHFDCPMPEAPGGREMEVLEHVPTGVLVADGICRISSWIYPTFGDPGYDGTGGSYIYSMYYRTADRRLLQQRLWFRDLDIGQDDDSWRLYMHVWEGTIHLMVRSHDKQVVTGVAINVPLETGSQITSIDENSTPLAAEGAPSDWFVVEPPFFRQRQLKFTDARFRGPIHVAPGGQVVYGDVWPLCNHCHRYSEDFEVYRGIHEEAFEYMTSGSDRYL